MLVPHTTYAHALCSCAHMTDDSRLSPPPSFSHVPKQNGCFLRSAIIPSAECRQRNYLVGTPAHPISMGNKAKPFRQIWNKHIQTFCLSHLGTTNGFSSYSRLKIYAYLHRRSPLSKYHCHFACHEVALYLPMLSSLH